MGCNNRKVAVFIENVMLMNELVQERVEVICRKRPSIRCIEQKIVNICGIQVGTRANCILLLPEQAVEYVWEQLVAWCFSNEAKAFMDEWRPIREALQHRPFHPESEEYQRFIDKNNLTQLSHGPPPR